MSEPYWQAKIWGLLHDPALKALHDNTGRGKEGVWQIKGKPLECMQGWVSPKAKSFTNAQLSTKWLKHVGLCDLISSASDRAAIGRLPHNTAIDYDSTGLEIRHLLSGKEQKLKLGQWHKFLMELKGDRAQFLTELEQCLIPDEIIQETDAKKVFWWFWRCYPQVLSRALDRDYHIPDEPCLHLLPAETRLPDASLWSHTTMTSALAGALAGYYDDPDDYPKKGISFHESRPHVGIFSLTPVQELIKASRKMRDFWAGSWLLHYLSAKICWGLAWKYGPDTLLYPCLYEQPLIDHWLLQKYPTFKQWIEPPSEQKLQKLLTAGFPNVLVMILPDNGASQTDKAVKNPVQTAMCHAKQTLTDEWQQLGKEVLDYLQSAKWMPELNPHTWDDWLKRQWQTYWVALPIGDAPTVLHHSPRKPENYEEWVDRQNQFACPKPELFVEPESEFLQATYEAAIEEDYRDRHSPQTKYKAKKPNLNVGSWWGSIFDQTRFALNAVKNARNWQLPTAFGSRSSVSGIGSVVHPYSNNNDWITEGEVDKFWDNPAGLFDGVEQLNATEVLKRGLHRILPKVLFPDESERQHEKLSLFYPDLSSGVAGWLRQMSEKAEKGDRESQQAIAYFSKVCKEISKEFEWTNNRKDAPARLPWGIPWIAENHPNDWHNPRLLNASWLIDDFEPKPNSNQPFTRSEQKKEKQKELEKLRKFIAERFPPGNNPTDWYVLAAGDGDGMGDWLKGAHLKPYSHYIPEALLPKLAQMPEKLQEKFQGFLDIKKRMGPATHSALSRALLDFSNQLVPYLTEERYAGRLIYGGGDDVLAYTNLWEWDNWLWDIRQCFQGGEDPKQEFESKGDYWRWLGNESKPPVSKRPLFTMGSSATISFGVVIAHDSVPLAIALENLWASEAKAKEHQSHNGGKKNAVQVRVLYGNGNTLESTAKFAVFNQWQQLLNASSKLESSLFEQAASVWSQHPAPESEAIAPWVQAFCTRRDLFKNDDDARVTFQRDLANFLCRLWQSTSETKVDREIQNWLKLAAFVKRNREIQVGGQP